jgi:hypothetical protein
MRGGEEPTTHEPPPLPLPCPALPGCPVPFPRGRKSEEGECDLRCEWTVACARSRHMHTLHTASNQTRPDQTDRT